MINRNLTHLTNLFNKQKLLYVSIFWGSLAGVLSQGLNFTTNIFLARFLGLEYGTLVYYSSTNNMLQGLTQVGLNIFATVIVAKNLNKNKNRLSKIIPNMYYVVVVLAAVISIIALVVNNFQFWGIKLWNLDSSIFLFFIILWLITSSLDVLQVSILLGLGAFKDIAKVSLVKGVFTIVLVLISVKLYGIQGVLVAYGLSFLVSLVFNMYFIKKSSIQHQLLFEYKIEYTLIKYILKKSFPVFLASLFMIPTQWGLNYVIYNKENGKLALSIFGIANQWMLLIQFFPLQIAKVLLPMLSRHKNNLIEYKSTEKTGLIISVLFCIFLITGSVIFENQIFNMYHLDYVTANYPFRFLLLAALFSTINLFLGHGIIAKDKAWMRTLIDAFMSICLFFSFLIVLSYSIFLALPIAYCFSFLLGSVLIILFERNKYLKRLF